MQQVSQKKFLDEEGLTQVYQNISENFLKIEDFETSINIIEQELNTKKDKSEGDDEEEFKLVENNNLRKYYYQMHNSAGQPLTKLKMQLVPTTNFDTNLINFDTLIQDFYLDQSGKPTSSVDDVYTDLIPVTPGDHIYWMGVCILTGNTNRRRIHGYDSNGNWVKQLAMATVNGNYEKYIIDTVIPNNISYIRVGWKQDINVAIGIGHVPYRIFSGKTSLILKMNNVDYTYPLSETPFYGGEIDLINGTFVETWGYIESYNGEPLNGVWDGSITNYDPNDSSVVPETGEQVLYMLDTPVEKNFTPLSIIISKGSVLLESESLILSIGYLSSIKVFENIKVNNSFKLGNTSLSESQLKALLNLLSSSNQAATE